jgi:hypothetical protein
MKIRTSLIACALALSGTLLVAAEQNYPFTNVVLGPLTGQDGWINLNPSGPGLTIAVGAGLNTSQVVHADLTGSDQSYYARKNDAAFAFPALTGRERACILEVWVLTVSSSPSQAYFALGFRPDSSSPLLKGPMFGWAISGETSGFQVAEAGYDGESHYVTYGSGDHPVQYGHWYRLQLHINFLAFDGEGAGSLFAQDLTAGETTLTPVTTLQNLRLNIRSNLGTEARPALWDQMVIGGAGGTQLDNLSVNPCGAPGSCDPGLVIRASQVELSWFAVTNVTYQLEYKSTVTDSAWTPLGAPIAGSNATVCVWDPISAGQPQRIYRITETSQK